MSTKISVKAAARAAKQEDARMRTVDGKRPPNSAATWDAFVNQLHKIGYGADNALTSGTYGFNPISRNRTLLEWIHRGSWLGGVAVDVVADDMTRNGINFLTEMEAGDKEKIESFADRYNVWDSFNQAIKWGRLYGGSLCVYLIDGQDMKTPLRLETVGKDQFKGLFTLDRWMVEPSLSDLVTDYGPHLGLPKYYTVQSNAPALRGQVIHHSRIAMRNVGIELPYQQSLTENLWGISVLERLYDRMIAFDSGSMGAAQLIFKAHLRTLKIPHLREMVASGGQIMKGLYAYTDVMRRFQGIEGITMIDGDDEFDVQGSGQAISGVEGILDKLADQLSGALQIPKTRLFGMSPGGLNSTGESDLRTYYDGITQKQKTTMGDGVLATYRLIAASEQVKLPDNFGVEFASLWDLDDKSKSSVAKETVDTVTAAKENGLISDQVAMQELRQSSRITGIFTNITQEMIDKADDQITPPIDENALAGLMNGDPNADPEDLPDEKPEPKPPTKDRAVKRVVLHVRT